MTPDHISWPHAPPHRVFSPGTYMVTAGTYLKQHILNTPEKLNLFQSALFTISKDHHWQLEAWAILSNHYHFIGYSNQPTTLHAMIHQLHGMTSFTFNQIDGCPGRQTWYQYYDSHITIQTSHYARLNYVHHNPVKHKVVEDARNYAWCSAGWQERTASSSYVKTVKSFGTSKLNVFDDF